MPNPFIITDIRDLPKGALPIGKPIIVTRYISRPQDRPDNLYEEAVKELPDADYLVLGGTNMSETSFSETYYQAVQAYADPKKKK